MRVHVDWNNPVARLGYLAPGNFLLAQYGFPPHSGIVDDQNGLTQNNPQRSNCEHQSDRNPQQIWMCRGARVILPGPESRDQSKYSQGQKNAHRVSGPEPTLPICHSCSSHRCSMTAAVLIAAAISSAYRRRKNSTCANYLCNVRLGARPKKDLLTMAPKVFFSSQQPYPTQRTDKRPGHVSEIGTFLFRGWGIWVS